MQVEIRVFAGSDAREVYQLNRDEMGYDYPLEETERKLQQLSDRPSDRIYVAVAENKVVGYVHANDYDVIYAPHMKNIMGIAVAKEYKRMGIGRALLRRVEEWAMQTGAKAVRLVSGSSRTEAHAFYRSCGYRCDKTQLHFQKQIQVDG